jgi:hypothetical protein
VAEAVQRKNSGKYKSYADAARILGVPGSSVYARASGRQTCTQAHEHEQLLSEVFQVGEVGLETVLTIYLPHSWILTWGSAVETTSPRGRIAVRKLLLN